MTHPNPDPYARDTITSDTSPCPTCSWPVPSATAAGMVCQTCGRDYTGRPASSMHEPRIFDGPTTVIPDRVKTSLGFDAGSDVRAFDVTGIRLVVLVTDADVGNAHMGGAAGTEERIDILRQVLAGLEALQ